MAPDRALVRRLAIGLVPLALLALVAYAALAFISVVVFGIFLYYAVRPIYRFLDRFGLSERIRAVLALTLFGTPFLVLLGYTVAIIALEVQDFLEEQDLLDEASARLSEELNVAGLDLAELEALLDGSGSAPSAEAVLESVVGAASTVGSGFVQLLLIVVLTYYFLVEGPDFVEWALRTYDESGVLREYVRAVDPELSKTLFGNIVTVFVTAIMAVTTFLAFNLLVPETIQIPFPALAGALAGICSLIPVVGIKLVYVPITVGLGANALLADEPELLAPLVVLFLVSAFIVDFVPDIFVRAKVSSDETHDGMLIVAYIVGPALFGFYGLFLAPIVLVATTNAVTILLPYVLSGDTAGAGQRTLSEFEDGQPPAEGGGVPGPEGMEPSDDRADRDG